MTFTTQADPSSLDFVDMINGNDQLTLNIGKGSAKIDLQVPRKLICSKSMYFNTLYGSIDSDSTAQRTVLLDDEDPIAFRNIVTWLYKDKIPLTDQRESPYVLTSPEAPIIIADDNDDNETEVEAEFNRAEENMLAPTITETDRKVLIKKIQYIAQAKRGKWFRDPVAIVSPEHADQYARTIDNSVAFNGERSPLAAVAKDIRDEIIGYIPDYAAGYVLEPARADIPLAREQAPEQTLPSRPATFIDDLLTLILTAERYSFQSLADQALTALISIQLEEYSSLLNCRQIELIYNHHKKSSKSVSKLRRYAGWTYTYILLEGDYKLSPDGTHMGMMRRLLTHCEGLEEDFFGFLQGMNGSTLKDPRKVEGCEFHQHGDGGICELIGRKRRRED